MKVLKGLAVSLLSFLLFLCLSLFSITFSLKSTILSPDFVIAEIDKINLPVVVKELAEPQLSRQLTPEVQFLKEPIYGIISSQEKWLKEQAGVGVRSFYDFMLGKSEKLSFTISLETFKANLKDSVKQAFLKSVPPQFAAMPPATLEQTFDQFYQQFAAQIPSKLEVTERQIPPEMMTQLRQAREVTGYFQLGHNLLIGFLALLVLLIIFIQLDVKKTTRGLGTTLLIYGVFEYAGVWVGKSFLPTGLPLPGVTQVPPSLQAWLSQLMVDSVKPLETFGLGCLVGGVVLLVVSFVYPRRAEG